MSYTNLMENWFNQEKKNGLIDLKIFTTNNPNINIESLSKELFEAINLEPVYYDII